MSLYGSRPKVFFFSLRPQVTSICCLCPRVTLAFLQQSFVTNKYRRTSSYLSLSPLASSNLDFSPTKLCNKQPLADLELPQFAAFGLE